MVINVRSAAGLDVFFRSTWAPCLGNSSASPTAGLLLVTNVGEMHVFALWHLSATKLRIKQSKEEKTFHVQDDLS